MREYLYIDDVEVNSLLAQENKGITTSKTVTESNSTSSNHSTTVGGEAKGGGEGRIPFLAKAQGELAIHYDSTNAGGIENTDQTAVDTVLNDYVVTLLENYLKNKVKNGYSNVEVSDIVNVAEAPHLYDFETMYNSTDHDLLKKVMQFSVKDDIDKIKEKYNNAISKNSSLKSRLKQKQKQEIKEIESENDKSLEGLDSINLLGEYGKKIFPNTIILASNRYIAYAKTKDFRMNTTQLNSIANSPRKMHVLGIVENKLETNPMDAEINDISDISKLGSSFTTALLFNFAIAKVGMLVLKPLVIYYEI